MAIFASAAGISLTHVPYKGATQAATDVASGRFLSAFKDWGRLRRWSAAAQLSLIGVATGAALAAVPQRAHRLGFVVRRVSPSIPGLRSCPGRHAEDIVARLNGEVLQALADGVVRRKLEELGFAIRGSSAEDLGRDPGSARETCAFDQRNGHRQRVSGCNCEERSDEVSPPSSPRRRGPIHAVARVKSHRRTARM